MDTKTSSGLVKVLPNNFIYTYNKMKKEVENKNSFIMDITKSESSSDESDEEISIENKEEIKKEIENYLLNSDDEKTVKKTPPKKTKKLVKKRETSSDNSVDQDQEKPILLNQSKSQRNPSKKTHPRKVLYKVMISKDFKKRQKKLGASSLDYSKRKNKKYMVEYEGKEIHFGSIKTEDYLIHKDLDQRDKYLTKAMKITNKDGEFSYQFPKYPNYWSIKLLN